MFPFMTLHYLDGELKRSKKKFREKNGFKNSYGTKA
jgi:hypothetical protein